MVERKLITIPNELLRKECRTITKIAPKVETFAEELVKFLEAHKDDRLTLVAVSANQLGESIRMFAFRSNLSFSGVGDIQVIINPVLVYAKGLHLVNECCLSIPNKTFTLQRHKLVKIRGLTLDGKERSFRARDILAQTFEHELNHLDGILIDKIGRLHPVMRK